MKCTDALIIYGILSKICRLWFVNIALKVGPSTPAQPHQNCYPAVQPCVLPSQPLCCYWLGVHTQYSRADARKCPVQRKYRQMAWAL